jgi:MFS family permease
VISDYFPASRRASALSIYALGIPIGASLAAIGGGWLTQNFDWRAAFWLLGAPGLLAAVLLKLTVREPPRTGVTTTKAPSFGEAVKMLRGKPSYWHAAFGGALMSFAGYGSSQFLVSYMVRSYDLAPTLPEEIAIASYTFGIIAGIATGLGTFMGGFLCDRWRGRFPAVRADFPLPLSRPAVRHRPRRRRTAHPRHLHRHRAADREPDRLRPRPAFRRVRQRFLR